VILLNTYYQFKPLIPRRLQVLLRRALAKKKRADHQSVWPIDRNAAHPPDGWRGWPNGKKFAFVLNHDVDTARGHDRCLELKELESRLGFRSTFFFVPEGYRVSPGLRRRLRESGFDVGVHGLLHDGKMFRSRKIFHERAVRINDYIKEWKAVGFSSPSMHRNLAWIGELNIVYDISTFDTDPFEPQPQGAGTIFPFWVPRSSREEGYIELPYTLPQDHCLYIILGEDDNRIWKEKLDWIVENGGMALINSHPDYMNFNGGRGAFEEYPVSHYGDFLRYAKDRYEGRYWNALCSEIAAFWMGQPFGRNVSADKISLLSGLEKRTSRNRPA